MIREPAVAGAFYDSDPKRLREHIEQCFLGKFGPGHLPIASSKVDRNITGLVCPHAGYQYSGYAAASAYAALAEDGLPDTAVIIGPNHRGFGAKSAIMTEGEWKTPLGIVEIDSEIASIAVNASGLLQHDTRAHIQEHSVEVQVPFLQYLNPKIKIVPIVLSVFALDESRIYSESIGKAIADAIGGRNAVVIASTDFTHYESKTVAAQKDHEAISAIEEMDYMELLNVVERSDISMCGVVPTATTVVAASALGASRAQLLTYYTSGDITGDVSQVVGYGALAMIK